MNTEGNITTTAVYPMKSPEYASIILCRLNFRFLHCPLIDCIGFLAWSAINPARTEKHAAPLTIEPPTTATAEFIKYLYPIKQLTVLPRLKRFVKIPNERTLAHTYDLYPPNLYTDFKVHIFFLFVKHSRMSDVGEALLILSDDSCLLLVRDGGQGSSGGLFLFV